VRSACRDKGFTVDYNKGDNYYRANNDAGWQVSIDYEGNQIMSIRIDAPDTSSGSTNPSARRFQQLFADARLHVDVVRGLCVVHVRAFPLIEFLARIRILAHVACVIRHQRGIVHEGNQIMSIRIDAPDTSSGSTTSEPSPDSSTSSATAQNDGKLVNGMRKDFKEAMDSYEAFMNEYVAFMKKYNANPNDPTLMADYARYMSKYADACVKFNKWESADMNDAETAYYIDVLARVCKKLLEAAG